MFFADTDADAGEGESEGEGEGESKGEIESAGKGESAGAAAAVAAAAAAAAAAGTATSIDLYQLVPIRAAAAALSIFRPALGQLISPQKKARHIYRVRPSGAIGRCSSLGKAHQFLASFGAWYWATFICIASEV